MQSDLHQIRQRNTKAGIGFRRAPALLSIIPVFSGNHYGSFHRGNANFLSTPALAYICIRFLSRSHIADVQLPSKIAQCQ
jgi:hypothetical protein